MKRHSDPKAFLRERRGGDFRWGGRIGDRPPEERESSQRSSNAETPSPKESLEVNTQAAPEVSQREAMTATAVLRDTGGGGPEARAGRLIPVGEHHEGSFSVYMAHKISKLRQQTDGRVAPLQGTLYAWEVNLLTLSSLFFEVLRR